MVRLMSQMLSWLKRLLIITHTRRQISQKSDWTVQALSARQPPPPPPRSCCWVMKAAIFWGRSYQSVFSVSWICGEAALFKGSDMQILQLVDGQRARNEGTVTHLLPLSPSYMVPVFMGVDCLAGKHLTSFLWANRITVWASGRSTQANAHQQRNRAPTHTPANSLTVFFYLS